MQVILFFLLVSVNNVKLTEGYLLYNKIIIIFA